MNSRLADRQTRRARLLCFILKHAVPILPAENSWHAAAESSITKDFKNSLASKNAMTEKYFSKHLF